ncbi:MAG: hypothetical protein FJZ15_03300, partial [Candidatus Omnitrophica bacterium]|nr:hypothetical protein [Candidatus Omnitrophota bacterium]
AIESFFDEFGKKDTIYFTHPVNFRIARELITRKEFGLALTKLRNANVLINLPDICDKTIRILSDIPTETALKRLEEFLECDTPMWVKEYALRVIDRIKKVIGESPSACLRPGKTSPMARDVLETFKQIGAFDKLPIVNNDKLDRLVIRLAVLGRFDIANYLTDIRKAGRIRAAPKKGVFAEIVSGLVVPQKGKKEYWVIIAEDSLEDIRTLGHDVTEAFYRQIKKISSQEAHLKAEELEKSIINDSLDKNISRIPVDIVMNTPAFKRLISPIVRSQDRLEDTAGYFVEQHWAEEFKDAVLQKALNVIKGRDIVVLQMEYELSQKFLDAFCEALEKAHGLNHNDAVYNTGEIAKILMAGGLGSFKPDLVKAWYEVLAKYWGIMEAKDRLHVFGVLYSESIKGHGRILPRGLPEGMNLVDLVRKSLTKVGSFKNVEINLNNIGKVDIEIYMNPFSDLAEYWLYCPRIFHEAYCGNADDDFRAVQTLLYRKVMLPFLLEHAEADAEFIFSSSEVNTTIAMPAVIDDEFKHHKRFRNAVNHHYNHTVVPAGMPYYHWWMFDLLKISSEFKDAVHDGKVDLVKITGKAADFITGCSSFHTRILREQIFQDFADKVAENDLFGNSEGSEIERWQGREVKELIAKFMKKLGVNTYIDLFSILDKDAFQKESFVTELASAKQAQKARFIEEIFQGTFGSLDFKKEDFENMRKKLMDMPFFTFVRRMVQYKCSDLIIVALYNPGYRERIINANAVIFVGGRSFDMWALAQRNRVKELIKQDPRMKYHVIFIEDHDVFTSWLIQQGTNFGGMLSWDRMEAGPTSYCNAQQNGAPTIATLDGVIPERLKAIKRDNKGNILSGTGYIVEYDNQGKPSIDSLVKQIEQACADYAHRVNYGIASYNALKMGILQGDIRNQAKGLLCVWADQIRKKQTKPKDASAEGKSREEVDALVEKYGGIDGLLQNYGKPDPLEVFGWYSHNERLLEKQGIQSIEFIRGPPELGVANYVENGITYIIVPRDSPLKKVQHEISAILNPELIHTEVLSKFNSDSNKLRLVKILAIPAFFIAISYFFGDKYVSAIKSSLLSKLIIMGIMGGLARGCGSYISQTLQGKGMDWVKVRRWIIAGIGYNGLIAYGLWFWIQANFISSNLWKVVVDLTAYTIMIALPANYLIQKYFIYRNDARNIDFKNTLKDFARIYIFNTLYWGTVLFLGWTFWPERIVLIAANMTIIWSGILIYLLDLWINKIPIDKIKANIGLRQDAQQGVDLSVAGGDSSAAAALQIAQVTASQDNSIIGKEVNVTGLSYTRAKMMKVSIPGLTSEYYLLILELSKAGLLKFLQVDVFKGSGVLVEVPNRNKRSANTVYFALVEESNERALKHEAAEYLLRMVLRNEEKSSITGRLLELVQREGSFDKACHIYANTLSEVVDIEDSLLEPVIPIGAKAKIAATFKVYDPNDPSENSELIPVKANLHKKLLELNEGLMNNCFINAFDRATGRYAYIFNLVDEVLNLLWGKDLAVLRLFNKMCLPLREMLTLAKAKGYKVVKDDAGTILIRCGDKIIGVLCTGKFVLFGATHYIFHADTAQLCLFEKVDLNEVLHEVDIEKDIPLNSWVAGDSGLRQDAQQGVDLSVAGGDSSAAAAQLNNTGAVVATRSEQKKQHESTFKNVVRQITTAAEVMSLDPQLLEQLINPAYFKEVRMDIPVTINGKVIHLIGFRIVHNDARGAGKGGIRFDDVKALDDLSLEELEQTVAHILDEDRSLATWMSLKNAVALIPYGGGKGCVAVPLSIVPKDDRGQEVVAEIHAQIIRQYVRKAFEQNKYLFGPFVDVPAPDMRTKGIIMAWFLDEHLKLKTELGKLEEHFIIRLSPLLKQEFAVTETPFYDAYVQYGGSVELGTITGKPVYKADVKIGGSLGREAATGQGVVYTAIEALRAYGEELGIGSKLKGRSVAVQAMGNVGGHAARIFYEEGAKIVAVSDFPGMIFDEEGINIVDLFARIKKDGMKKAFEETKGFVGVAKGESPVLELAVDILVPAFREKQITKDNAGRVRAKMIVEGANGPTTPEADVILEKNGILVVPDILANTGGVVVSYFEWLQNLKGEHWSEVAVNKMLQQRIAVSSHDVFNCARQYNVSLRIAATILAMKRICSAMVAKRAATDGEFMQRVTSGAYIPYQGYDILECYETDEELNLIYLSGKYQGFVDSREKQIDREIENIAKTILEELPQGQRRFVLISGPNAVGKPFFASRLMEAARGIDKGIATYSFDLDDNSDIFTAICEMPAKSILFITGDYALDPNFMRLFDPAGTYSIFVNTAPSLKVDGNRPFTSSDLRLMRYILEQACEGRGAIDVIREWPRMRKSQIEVMYPAWINAKATFNAQVGYELPFLMIALRQGLRKAYLLAKESFDAKSMEIAEDLLKLFDGFTPMPDLKIEDLPLRSMPRQFVSRQEHVLRFIRNHILNDAVLSNNEPAVVDRNRIDLGIIWNQAISETARILQLSGKGKVIAGLYSNEPRVHTQFRFILAKLITEKLSNVVPGVIKIWLFGSVSISDLDVGPGSDIDLLIEVDSEEDKIKVTEFMRIVNIEFAKRFNTIMKGTDISIQAIFDIEGKVFVACQAHENGFLKKVKGSVDAPPTVLYENTSLERVNTVFDIDKDTLLYAFDYEETLAKTKGVISKEMLEQIVMRIKAGKRVAVITGVNVQFLHKYFGSYIPEEIRKEFHKNIIFMGELGAQAGRYDTEGNLYIDEENSIKLTNEEKSKIASLIYDALSQADILNTPGISTRIRP